MNAFDFETRAIYNLAKHILSKELEDTDFFPIDDKQRIIFTSVLAYKDALSELGVAQIWDVPSFKGPADFKIVTL